MITARHPAVAGTIVSALETNVKVPFVREVQRCVDTLVAADFVVPSWEELADGLRNHPSQDEEELSPSTGGRRSQAIPLTTGSYRSSTPRSQCDQALLRSQSGQLVAVSFVCFPTSRLTRLDPLVFRTFLFGANEVKHSPRKTCATLAYTARLA